MLTKISLCMFLTVISLHNLSNFASADNYQLKSISVLFRHGDRAPDTSAMYPNDPYQDHNFHPLVPGGLTNTGKKRAYEIGRFLRKRYNYFLGDMYFPNDVFARSTDYDRTKMSLMLVLAGLYPPNNEQCWNSILPWQPIPITYVPVLKDSLLFSINCPTFKKERARVEQSPAYKKDISMFTDDMVKLSEFTGLNITTSKQILSLYNTLTAEVGLNLTLPEWTKSFFPEGVIKQGAIFNYKTLSYNTKLTRLNGGMLLRKFLNDAIYTKQGKQGPMIFLYSAHETTVSSLLWALKTWKPEIPEYSSATILELWEKESKYYVKIVYYKGIPQETENRTIEGCAELCPLEHFEQILYDILPDDYDKECFKLI